MQGKLLAALAAGVIASPALAGDVIFSTISEWDGVNRSNGWDKIAQTFIVPIEENFLIRYSLFAGSDTDDTTFNLLVYEWDRTTETAVGDAVYDSGAIGVTGGAGLSQFFFAPNVALTPGDEFAAIVHWAGEGGDGVGIGFLSGSSYTDGYANFTDGAVDEVWSFNQNSGFDTAFEAVFTVPAPGALAVLGLAAISRRRRRR